MAYSYEQSGWSIVKVSESSGPSDDDKVKSKQSTGKIMIVR